MIWKNIFSLMFVYLYYTLVYVDLFDPRWQELIAFCQETQKSIPILFHMVVLVRDILFWLGPFFALILLVHIEISNKGRGMLIILLLVIGKIALYDVLGDIGYFMYLANEHIHNLTLDISIEYIWAYLCFLLAGIIATHEKIWWWYKNPQRKFFGLILSNDISVQKSPVPYLVLALILLSLSDSISDKIIDTKAKAKENIHGVSLEHISFSPDFTTNIEPERLSLVTNRIIYTGTQLRDRYIKDTSLFIEIHVQKFLLLAPEEDDFLQVNIEGKIFFFYSMADLIHKKHVDEKEFHFSAAVLPDQWQNSECFYLFFFNSVGLSNLKKDFTFTDKLQLVQKVSKLSKKIYSTPKKLLTSNEYDFAISKFSHDIIKRKGNTMLFNDREVELDGSLGVFDISPLGTTTIAQIGDELYVIYNKWQDNFIYWDFPDKIKHITIDNYSFSAYLCTQSNAIYQIDLRRMELVKIGHMSFEVYDIKTCLALGYVFIVGEYEKVVFYSTKEEDFFELSTEGKIISSIDISIDNRYILYSSGKTVYVVETSSWEEIRRYTCSHLVRSVSFCEYNKDNFVVLLENGNILKN